MCFGYFDLGLASEANAYHRFAILELAAVASFASSKPTLGLLAVKTTDADWLRISFLTAKTRPSLAESAGGEAKIAIRKRVGLPCRQRHSH